MSASLRCLEENKRGRDYTEACARVVQESVPEEVTLELRPESAEEARNSKGWGEGKGREVKPWEVKPEASHRVQQAWGGASARRGRGWGREAPRPQPAAQPAAPPGLWGGSRRRAGSRHRRRLRGIPLPRQLRVRMQPDRWEGPATTAAPHPHHPPSPAPRPAGGRRADWGRWTLSSGPVRLRASLYTSPISSLTGHELGLC